MSLRPDAAEARRIVDEGAIICAASDHTAERDGSCSCGFCMWSGIHVAVMAFREAHQYGANR
jgi:hypothetical protein